ncbi:hypothetical protein [Pseudomonas sp. LP_7_YM]|uniref:hypothetical protein n=1 Tax=Pseudomonas sp. LP_7_YM TaxID=2485137 RepID=UPI00105E2E3E|nr:hypothetical protein [Pseudomonas sp. LP_7_YM]TDV60839.1 hypothetical protein EC915_11084 [Pseudomonas sp. LP_7_YM]
MSFPINNANDFNPYINAHAEAARSVPQAAPRPVMRPGAGIGSVNGQQVSMAPLSRSGFTSAFSTQQTSVVAHRARLAISARNAQQILANTRDLSQKAARDMHAIATLELRGLEATYEIISLMSKNHIARFSRSDIDTIVEALDDYQAQYGDNFLMNVSAMGYPSLEHYLDSTGVRGTHAVETFIREFTDRHTDASDLTEDDMDEIKTRLTDRLAEPTSILKNFIHTGPRLSSIPLLKGATGTDNPVTTQVNGADTVISALNGQAINFNGFLSTTADFSVALEFAGLTAAEDLGTPMFTVDLNSNSEESEVLRRTALRFVQSKECDTDSILYYFKSNNVAGISINATKASAYPDVEPDRLATEDEILLNPGHFFQPEQIVLHSGGVAMIGSLSYGRDTG